MLSGWFRLTTVSQLKNVNDCCYSKQSLHGIFLAGPLYTLSVH